MFSAIRELTPPGVVEHCVRARFTRPDRAQLVLGRSRRLEVYDLDPEQGVLRLEASFGLFGVVESVCTVRPAEQEAGEDGAAATGTDPGATSSKQLAASQERDLIMLTFGTGRASLVAYDPELGPHMLRTVALYNFESDSLGSNLRAESSGQIAVHGYGASAVCLVDPLMRCGSMLVNGFQVGVMPFDRLRSMAAAGAAERAAATEEALADARDEEQVVESEERKLRLAKAVRRVAMEAKDVWEMPSGCYLIDLTKVGIPADSVQHMEFLENQHGLPVLAVLHSGKTRTSTGRLVIARWTTQLTAITISKQDVTVVWRVRKLPHDSFAIVPKSDGSVLVLSQNTVHHVVGGFVRRTVELNGFARLTANLDPVSDTKTSVELVLDGARWVWLDAHRLLFSLRYGQLALLDCGPTSLRLTLQALSNQSSCLCLLDSNYLFLGSRLADSLLMTFKFFLEDTAASVGGATDRLMQPPGGIEAISEPQDEEAFLYGAPPAAAAHSAPGTELEGPPAAEGVRLVETGPRPPQRRHWVRCKAVSLRTTDALPCTGPVASLCAGDVQEDLLEMKRAREEAELLKKRGMHSAAARLLRIAKGREQLRRKPKEIVSTAGRGRDGGVRVRCPGLRLDTHNDLLCDRELRGPAQSVWALRPDPARPETLVFCTMWGSNRFEVFRCRGDNMTAILEPLDAEAAEPFEMAMSPTIAMFASEAFLLQLCLDKIVVTEKTPPFKVVKTHALALRAASMTKSHLAVVLRSREVKLFEVNEETGNLEEAEGVLPEGSDEEGREIAAVHVQQDPEPPFTLMLGLVRGGLADNGAGGLEVYDVGTKRLLFRSDCAIALGRSVLSHRAPDEALEPHRGVLAKLKVVSLCIAPVGRIDEDPHCSAHLVAPRLCVGVALANGDFLLYRVQADWRKLYRVETDVVTRIDRSILHRSWRQPAEAKEGGAKGEAGEDRDEDRAPRAGMRRATSMEVDEAAPAGDSGGGMKRKLSSAFNGAEASQAAADRDAAGGADAQQMGRKRTPGLRHKSRLVAFDYLGGFCGMMLMSDAGPSMCVLGSRGVVAPVRIDYDTRQMVGTAVGRGRLYCLAANTKRAAPGRALDKPPQLMIFQGFKLMRHLRVDVGGSVPVVQVPLGASVLSVEFDEPSRSYLMLCAEDDPGEERALAVRAQSSVRLLCADTLKVVHQHSMMRFEKAIKVSRVTIDLAGPNSQPRRMSEFLAVGTGFVGPDGEDSGCKGRVLIFQVEIVENEAGVLQKRIALRLKIESKHIRGPVTSVASVDGLLLATFGTTPASLRIFYYDPSTDAFVARSFVDTPFSAVSIRVVKNYIMVGDLYRSVQLLHWHNSRREFRQLARDQQPLEVFSCGFVRHERSLGMLVAEGDANLHLMYYDPNKTLLQTRGEIHLGSCVNDLVELRVGSDHSVTLYGTLDGALGMLVPLQEQVFRRLFALQAAMSTSTLVPRNAGLNPRAFRTAKFHFPLQRQRRRNIADGALLWSYLWLDYIAQRELARLIGTTPETIHQDLLELDTVAFSRAL